MPRTMLKTGADRAALDAALECGVEIGGWVPKGRKAEDGRIPDHYPNLRETPSDAFMGVVAEIREWLVDIDGDTLNVAGPRASSDPAIYEKTREIATELLRGV